MTVRDFIGVDELSGEFLGFAHSVEECKLLAKKDGRRVEIFKYIKTVGVKNE